MTDTVCSNHALYEKAATETGIRMARLEEKLDALKERIEDLVIGQLNQQGKRIEGLGERMDVLENDLRECRCTRDNDRAYMRGMVAVASVVSSAVVSVGLIVFKVLGG